MAVRTSRHTIGSTRELIAESSERDDFSAIVKNLSGDTAYLGGSDVTTANGYPLDIGESVTFSFDPGEELHARTAGVNAELSVLRISVP